MKLSSFGIDGELLNFISSYLGARIQRYLYRGTHYLFGHSWRLSFNGATLRRMACSCLRRPTESSYAPRNVRYTCAGLIGSCLLVAVLSILGQQFAGWMFSAIDNLDASGIRYGVVIDAGSTGSRVHVFKILHNSSDHARPFHLISEHLFSVEPGLSTFAKFPSEAIENLRPLVEYSREYVPEDWRSSTPIILRATAGLRLLPEKSANDLLASVSSLIRESGFWLPSEGAVGIMEGVDEGVFAWVTLNFLKGSLFTAFSQATQEKSRVLSGLLDFGGGSTQLTFLPLESMNLEASTPAHLLHTMPDCYVEHFNFPSKVYAHSYLGLGLMSARRSMLLTYTRASRQTNSTSSVLQSPCLPAGFLSQWSHSGQLLTISSSRPQPLNDSEETFEHCYESATSILRSSSSSDNIVHRPDELNSHDIFVLSFVYTRAVEAGLVNATLGGLITIRKLIEAAKSYCTHPQKEHPFMCMDLSYISALLHEGFGISLDKELHLYKKINAVEISWPLGLFFDFLLCGF
ncbi:Ectonucleoside triphosphate diphosphohydrolase 5 [Sparganum proliferum]